MISLLLALTASASAVSPAVKSGIQSGPPNDPDAGKRRSRGRMKSSHTRSTPARSPSAQARAHMPSSSHPPAPNTSTAVKLLVDGSTIVLLADVYGDGEEDEPEQEWTSTDGGASFNAVNAGKSVAEGFLNANTAPLNAVIVPRDQRARLCLGHARWPPDVRRVPAHLAADVLAETTTCSFATLQPEGSEHILGNEPGVFAAQSGSNSGVLGVYETLGKPGCQNWQLRHRLRLRRGRTG